MRSNAENSKVCVSAAFIDGILIQQLKVFYLGPEKTAYKDVQRIIARLLHPATNTISRVSCYPPGRVIIPMEVPIQAKSSLSLFQRPVTPGGGGFQSHCHEKNIFAMTRVFHHPGHHPGLAEEMGKFLLQKFREQMNINTLPTRDLEYWSSSPSHSLSAHFGHVIYRGSLESNEGNSILGSKPAETIEVGDERGGEDFEKAIQGSRTLFPSLPHVHQLFERVADPVSSAQRRYLIRLEPFKTSASKDILFERLFPIFSSEWSPP